MAIGLYVSYFVIASTNHDKYVLNNVNVSWYKYCEYITLHERIQLMMMMMLLIWLAAHAKYEQ